MSDENTQPTTTFAYESLEAVRKKLLDLTGRNSLLNYKYPSASCLRFIDKVPNSIVEMLKEGEVLTFMPVPEPSEKELIEAGYITVDPETGAHVKTEHPTAEQWAKYLGFNTSYDLPASRNDQNLDQKDKHMQVLQYGHRLEANLRNIRDKAESSIEETGSNILYLAIGFLEWYESNDSELIRRAPLFTLPVQLERSAWPTKDGTFPYCIKLKDEGLLTNITLKLKLQYDFGLGFPDIDEDTQPEDYFECIEKIIIKNFPRWRLRRHVSLVLLSFAKQVMYEDLNPDLWPENARIDKHPIISHFFGGDALDLADNVSKPPLDYDIDSMENIHDEFPLIYDADNSQHSAIIDVVKGENLVIYGPPGSGKSQTITNLIAALIANGKSVLFVAEKMAALNVVKTRLDKAGLGDFCLELHSHKTIKQKIINDLGVRLDKHNRFRKPADTRLDIQLYEEYKEKLTQYVHLINSAWKKTGLSLHEIFSRATRYRKQLKIDPDSLEINGINGENLTPIKQKEFLNNAEMLQDIYLQVSQQAEDGDIVSHYWYGINYVELNGIQIDKLIETLNQWNRALITLNEHWQLINVNFSLGVSGDISFDMLKRINCTLVNLPDLVGGEPLVELPGLVENLTKFESWLREYESIHEGYHKLLKIIKQNVVLEIKALDNLSAARITFHRLGIKESLSFSKFTESVSGLQSTESLVQAIYTGFDKIAPNLPLDLKVCFDLTLSGLKEYQRFIYLLNEFPSDQWQYRNPVYDNLDLDPLLEKMVVLMRPLLPLHNQLYKIFNLRQLPRLDVIQSDLSILKAAGIFKWLSPEWRRARSAIRQLSQVKNIKTRYLINLMPNLIRYLDGIIKLDNLNENENLLGEFYQGIRTPIDRIVKLRNWYKAVREEYGFGFSERTPIANAMFGLDRNLVISILDADKQGLGKAVSDVNNKVSMLMGTYISYKPLTDPTSKLTNTFSDLINDCKELFELINPIVFGSDFTIGDLAETVDRLDIQQKRVTAWKSTPFMKLSISAGLGLSVDPNNFSGEKLSVGNNLLNITRIVSGEPWLLHSLTAHPTDAHYLALRRSHEDLNVVINNADLAQNVFMTPPVVSCIEWLRPAKGEIAATIHRNQRAIDKPNWLPTWLDYMRLRHKLTANGMTNLIIHLEEHTIKTQELLNIIQLVLYHQLSKEILSENVSLSMFSGMEQMAIRKKFQEYDRKLMLLQQELVAFKADQVSPPIGVSSGKVKNYSELSLIRHNLGLKRPRIAIRTLLSEASNAIKALKPCFMMSPMSVAQYLTPGKFEFDVMIMDEASQIPPEDALGSIARGKKILIVGDPKQLPPTTFFQKTVDNDYEEGTALEQTESILETVGPMFKNRLLDWHYRSQSQKLIEFSNQKFYDSKLVIFPSPIEDSDEFGITYHRVRSGRFVNRRNVEEAKAVVHAAAEQMLRYPHDSVGIVAMNIEQRNELELQLERLIKDQPLLQDAYVRNQASENPIFIKNLENVQGDERDVIIISMTYGPDTLGASSMYQRFGPINSEVGWRRLNVLFTRSRKRMLVFSSMDSGFIITNENSSSGVRALKDWLAYCETGHLNQPLYTGRQPDSDFEIGVMDALREHGYQCVPQLGVAGYFLDAAVIDPGMPGRFLMGIECDGATYHSAKSTRERDRLRQEILERLGWKIHRIWSTDWFRNPEAQLMPIIRELAELKTPLSKDISVSEVSQESVKIDSADFVQSPPHLEKRAITLETNISDGLDLRARLEKYDRDVIRRDLPNNNENSRLLRPAMLEALLNIKPCSKAEFIEVIPAYLREATSVNEAKYLDSVLGIIASYG